LIDYIVHRFQTLGKIKMLEKIILDNQTQITTTFSKFEERNDKTTENCEKSLEEYKDCNRKLLDGLCRGIDAKLLEINFHIQDGLDALEKKLKLLINSELDKVDDGYDKLSRNLFLLQSNHSEYCENNSDRMTNLEETLKANYPHISLLTDKIETLNQYVEDIKKNVFKVDQEYYELKEMMSRELDGMQEEYFELYDECREKMEKSDEKMNLQVDVVNILKEFVKKYLRVYFPAEKPPEPGIFGDPVTTQEKQKKHEQNICELRELGAKYSIENW
jgi:chromosome segregation ATPase